MDVDRPRLDEAVAAPDEIEELVAAVHAARLGGERREQLELLRREADGPSPDGDLCRSTTRSPTVMRCRRASASADRARRTTARTRATSSFVEKGFVT
jgi:hypothetical protein